MALYQQLLTSVSEHSNETVDIAAQRMLKEMFSKIGECRSERKDTDLVFEVHPEPYFIPKSFSREKLQTKWERFAAEKGIKRKKRSQRVYSDEYKEWLPRWGSKSMKNLSLRGGMTEEVNVQQLRRDKSERVAKNQRNKEANKKKFWK